jgi:hypothetical protein
MNLYAVTCIYILHLIPVGVYNETNNFFCSPPENSFVVSPPWNSVLSFPPVSHSVFGNLALSIFFFGGVDGKMRTFARREREREREREISGSGEVKDERFDMA